MALGVSVSVFKCVEVEIEIDLELIFINHSITFMLVKVCVQILTLEFCCFVYFYTIFIGTKGPVG
jgi:hypothetical protein